MITLQKKLGHTFTDLNLLQMALTHKSFHNENRSESMGHNERLEFLGDAVLDLCLSELLMREFPQFKEGELSKIRASLVNEKRLAEISLALGLHDILRMGKGEVQSGGADKPRLLASGFEAVVGALFFDAGYDKANKYLGELFTPHLEQIEEHIEFQTDYKTRLQEKTQEIHKVTPTYNLIKEEGPDHEKVFHVQVCLEEKVLASGCGKSKKLAEQAAAREALEVLV